MKVRKARDEWYWINFKDENVPTFCFICGLLGHSNKFCSRLFVTQEPEIVRSYGDWMHAPFRRKVKPIGPKWLRNGVEGAARRTNGGDYQNPSRVTDSNHDPHFTPANPKTGT